MELTLEQRLIIAEEEIIRLQKQVIDLSFELARYQTKEIRDRERRGEYFPDRFYSEKFREVTCEELKDYVEAMEEAIPEIIAAVERREVLAQESRNRVMRKWRGI